jgi:hypothetical protein
VESTFNTKLRNPSVRPGPHWVSPRAVSWVWGCRPPSLVVLSSISRRLFQEPCALRGHLAGSFPPILHPSPPIFIPFFRLYFPHNAEQNRTTKHHHGNGDPPLRSPQPPPKSSIFPSNSDSPYSIMYLCKFSERYT